MKIKAFQTRAFSVQVDPEGQENPTFLPLVLSSETPVLRSFGNEILCHGPENIDFSRALPNGLPLLVCHNDQQLPIGRLKNVRLGDDRKLRGDAYFSGREEPQAIRQDIVGGIITDVSVGYKVLNHKVERSDTPNAPVNVYVTRWCPAEGSVVPFGADPTAGFGRSADMEGEIDLAEVEDVPVQVPTDDARGVAPEVPILNAESGISEGDPSIVVVTPVEAADLAAENATIPVIVLPDTPASDPATDPVRCATCGSNEADCTCPCATCGLVGEGCTCPDPEAEGARSEENVASSVITDIGEEFAALRSIALKLQFRSAPEVDAIIHAAQDIDAARALLLKPPTITSNDKATNMLTNEMIFRAMKLALNGDFSGIDETARPLIEMTGQRSFKIDMFGNDKLATRANEMTTAAGGTNTIYEQNIGFLDLLRTRTAVLQAGAKTKTGVGKLSYMRQKQAVTAALRGENAAAPANTGLDFEKVSYVPHALVAQVLLTDELQKESISDLQNIVRQDIIKQFAIGIDGYAITGNVAQNITGLLSAGSGVRNGDLGAAAVPTWATVNALKGLVDTLGVDLAACSYISTPALVAAMEAIQRFPNWGAGIVDNGKIGQFPCISSGNVPIAALNHTTIFGDFSNLEICLQGPTEFDINTSTYFAQGITVLTARQYFDVGVLQGLAFAKCANFKAA